MGFFDFLREKHPPLVEQAFRNINTMLESGHHMFASATGYLLDNEILDIDLKALDKDINEREQNLRRVVLEHLTLDPNRELIFCLKLISIVHEAERIGDLCKSLAKVAQLADKPRLGPPVLPLRTIRNQVLEMFDWTRKGFARDDENQARMLMQVHERIKDDTANYITMLARNDAITANEGVVYALGARMLARVSSHLANIASTVVSPLDRIRRAVETDDDIVGS